MDVEAGKTYTLEIEAMAEGIRRESGQFNNCYIGVMFLDANGKRIDTVIEDISDVKAWKKQKINFTPPANAKKSNVIAFLSKSGALKIRDIYVAEAIPSRPFRGTP